MLCYVDIEHERWLAAPETRRTHLSHCLDIKYRIEEITGAPCLVQRYGDVTSQGLRDLDIRALVIGGNAVGFEEYGDDAFTEMKRIIRAAEWPIIGFCGGHQLIAMAHDAPVGPMRRLRPGEPEITTLSGPGYLKEWGFEAVRTVRADPILNGLGPAPVFLEVHFCEVKQLPPGFRLLASTAECPIQLMKRGDRPVYGAQFHPEGYTEWPHDRRSELVNLVYPEGYAEARPDGRRLLENFCRVAGVSGRTNRTLRDRSEG